MAEPVYAMFYLRMTEAWYQLTEKQQNTALDKVFAINKKLRVETIILCDSGWSNDEWQFFGVDKFPNLETLQEQHKRFDEIPWFRYVYQKSILGTPWSRS